MSWEWLDLKNWRRFPECIQERCRLITDSAAEKIRVFAMVKKYNASYSFKFLLNSAKTKTVAKVIPHHSYSGPVILAAFSTTEPESRSYASKFETRVHEFVIMHQPFFVSKVPDDWNTHRVAEAVTEFMRGGQTRKRLEL